MAAHRDRLELVGIAARTNHRRLAEIARQFAVRHVGLFDNGALAEARADTAAFPAGTRLYGGLGGLIELAQLPEADMVLVAVVGTTGLQPALAALAARKDLALASKEILVLAGKFVMAAARASGVRLLPVDSEHNAVFQCLEGHPGAGGAPDRAHGLGRRVPRLAAAELARVTPADALRHPNWSMGPKITVDSATLANKGLELMEAQWLFGLRPDQCQAVLHPQSIVHCLVEFTDGAMLAQLAPPSMTFPIQHALLYPERAPGVDAGLDCTNCSSSISAPWTRRATPAAARPGRHGGRRRGPRRFQRRQRGGRGRFPRRPDALSCDSGGHRQESPIQRQF